MSWDQDVKAVNDCLLHEAFYFFIVNINKQKLGNNYHTGKDIS